MLQRIQSIFLLLASASGFGLFGLPFASTPETVQSSTLFADSIYNIQDNPMLLLFFTLAGILTFAAIFLFKNRKLQIKLSQFGIISNILGIVVAVVFFIQDSKTFQTAKIDDSIGLFLPVLFLIFAFLAIKFIKKDLKIVSSMDRLR